MTLLPGLLATAPSPSRASAAASSSRSGDSREFASALEGALGGAASPSDRRAAEKPETAQAPAAGEGGTPTTDVGIPMAQLSLIVPAMPPVVQDGIISDELPAAVPADVTDLGAVPLVATGAATDAAAGAGLVLPASGEPSAGDGTAAEPIRASASGPGSVAVSAIPVAPAEAMPVTQTPGAAAVPVGAVGGAGAEMQPAATRPAPTPANPAAGPTTGAAAASGAVADAAVGAAAIGSVAAAAVAPTPAAGTTAIATPTAAAVPQAAATPAGVSADTSGGASSQGQNSDQGQNNSGQLGMPGSVAAPITPSSPQAPAAVYAAVAASQSDAAASAPLSTQIARPLFSLANAAHGEHVMTISVTPDNLGPVTVRAHVGPEGVRVELFAPNDAGRDALRSIMADLKRDLAGSGMTGATLDLSNRDQAGNSPQQGRQADSTDRGRASVSAGEPAGDTAQPPERSTVPAWYGGIPSIDVMA